MRYIGGHVSISGGVQNAIDNTLKIGGNSMQIFAGSPRLWYRKPFSEVETEKFLTGIKTNNFGPVFIHALYLVNLATDNLGLLEKSMNSLVADMHNGQLINSAGVIVHIGSHQGRGFDTVKDQLVAVIERILDQTNNIDLILENDAGQNGKIGSIEELSYLIDTVKDDRLKICLDSAHLFESGCDLRQIKEIDLFVKQLKDLNLLDRLVCVHLNDSATKLDSHRDMHANIGDGEIGLEGLKNFINHQSLEHLPLILEVPGENKSGPDLKNITLVKGLTEK